MNKYELTCSSWQQGLCERTSCWPDIPSLWPPAARSPSDPLPSGSGENTTIRRLEHKARIPKISPYHAWYCICICTGLMQKFTCRHLSRVWSYVSLIADEVSQVAMLHVGQNHQWRTLRRQADPEKRENVGVTEVLHDDPFLQELRHLFQVCDAL